MTGRTERALIRFLLLWFRMQFPRLQKLPQEYLDLENELRTSI